MKAVKRYALIKRDEQSSLLTCDGRPLEMVLEGLILGAQFELEDGRALLWLTDNSPYDEGLHVYLLAPGGVAIEDSLEAGATFNAGILEIINCDENSVDFEFFLNSTIYRLEVAKEASFRLPLPTGWNYKRFLQKHRLVVRKLRTGAM